MSPTGSTTVSLDIAMDTLKLTVHNQGPPELLRPTFQPVMTTLTLSGQYFEWARRYRISASFLWCMLIWLFIWFTVIRYGFFYNHQMSPFEATVVALFHAWIIQIACAMTYLHLIGRRRFYEFHRKWEEYREEYKCVEMKHFRPHLLKWLAIFWVFTLASVILITIIYLHVTMYDLVNLKPFSDRKDIPVPYVILCALLTIYYTFIYFAPVVTLHIFCGSLNAEFDFIGTELKLLLRKMNYASADALEGMRQRHHVLCHVVSAFDGAWSPYLLLSFVFDVPLVAINIVVLIGTGYVPNIVAHLTQLYSVLASCVMGFLHIMVLTLAAASLAAHARAPLTSLYEVDMRCVDSKMLSTIQMFQQRLREHTGLTLGRLVRINRGLIVAVFAILVCYLLVMLRFSLGVDLEQEVKDRMLTSPRPDVLQDMNRNLVP